MKRRLTCALFALTFGVVAGCAEQPGKKKEEDTKSEAKTIDGKAAKPADAKPAAKPTPPAAPAPAKTAAPPAPPAPEAH